jgi:major membrane immunogen (membrane-anchored lipoprotein)
MTKKLCLITFACVLLLLLSGCNLKEKIGENITEGIIESASDGDVDVEIDGDEVTYTTDEGQAVINNEDGFVMETEDGTIVLSEGDNEWPVDQAAAYIPELKAGTLTYIFNSPESCMLSVEETTKDDYEVYEKEIIDAGYTVDKVESSAEDMELYSASSEEGVIVTISFVPSESILQVTVDASSKLE